MLQNQIIHFVIKPNFDNLGSIIEIENGWEIDFTQNETIREVLGFKSKRIGKELIIQIILLILFHSIIFSLK